MEFNVQGRRHVLRGSVGPKIKLTPKQQLSRVFLEDVHLSMIHIGAKEEMLLHSLTTYATQKEIPTEFMNLFHEFANVFPEPQQLPHFRPGHDHHIPLIQGVNPVNKRPESTNCSILEDKNVVVGRALLYSKVLGFN